MSEDDILELYTDVIQNSSHSKDIKKWLDVVGNVRNSWKEAMNKRKQPEVLETETSPPKNPPSKKKKLQATDLIY